MSKIGFTEDTIQPIISNQVKRNKWSLCIGAGTSLPLFPSWSELTKELIYEVTKSIPQQDIQELLNEFTPDSLIQAVFNRLHLNQEQYINLLSSKLYSKIKSILNPGEWQSFRNCLAAIEPNDIKDSELADFCDIVGYSEYRPSSHFIAKAVTDTIGTDLEPSAIISFNAENLLYATINAYARKKKRNNKKYLDLVNLSISDRHKKRIPYFFIHGSLPIPDCSEKQNKRLLTNDKLVFLENEYISLSNSSFSWQSNTFLELLSSTTVVFIGVSLTDANMRRWLALAQSVRVSEIKFFTKNSDIDTAKHYWINKLPVNIIQKKWIEASVSHLGVRLVWLNEWDHLGTVLNKMLKL